MWAFRIIKNIRQAAQLPVINKKIKIAPVSGWITVGESPVIVQKDAMITFVPCCGPTRSSAALR